MARKSAKQAFKMAELVRRTGLKKETIHFYINNDLLPRPRKTERNVAYYDESYVESIRLIKELQQKYFLPLKVIKQIVSQASARISTAEIDLLKLGMSGLLQLQELRRTHEPMTLDELGEKTGLPKEEILELESRTYFFRPGPGRPKGLREIDIKVVEAFAGIGKADGGARL
jgi:DNA-binding transcriptional MerR regulator